MARVDKLVSNGYLQPASIERVAVNGQNRAYIDRFVTENYKRLRGKFSNINNNINSSGFSAMDKLNEMLLSLYVNPVLSFANWEEAELYMLSKFTEKEMRVPVKVVAKLEEDQV